MTQQDFEQQLISNNFTREHTGINNTVCYLSPKFRKSFNHDRMSFRIKVELYTNNIIIYIWDIDTFQGNKGQSYNYAEGYDALKKLELIKENDIPLDYVMD